MSFRNPLLVSLIISVIIICKSTSVNAQEKWAYRIFDKKGKVISYQLLLKEAAQSNVVLLGEIHNNSLCHWLELQVLKDLYKMDSALVLGMEMFEADNQIILDEFSANTIQEKHVESEAKVWSNYTTDYLPMVQFCKSKKVKIVATNIPRRYANLVYRQGIEALDSLSLDAKAWMAPLPIPIDFNLPGYKLMTEGIPNHDGFNSSKLVAAQAIKDATMAHFIMKFYPGKVLHINGNYHSQNHEGIYWYLKKNNPSIKLLTIQMAEQKELNALEKENMGVGDFIIILPDDMTRTY